MCQPDESESIALVTSKESDSKIYCQTAETRVVRSMHFEQTEITGIGGRASKDPKLHQDIRRHKSAQPLVLRRQQNR